MLATSFSQSDVTKRDPAVGPQSPSRPISFFFPGCVIILRDTMQERRREQARRRAEMRRQRQWWPRTLRMRATSAVDIRPYQAENLITVHPPPRTLAEAHALPSSPPPLVISVDDDDSTATADSRGTTTTPTAAPPRAYQRLRRERTGRRFVEGWNVAASWPTIDDDTTESGEATHGELF